MNQKELMEYLRTQEMDMQRARAMFFGLQGSGLIV